MSDWIEITGNTDIGDLPDHLMTDLGLLRSRFVATAWPASPVPGQPCLRSDRGYRAYTYVNDPLQGESGWVEDALLSAAVLALKAELEASRGTAANLGARLSVAMNPDGTLKGTPPTGSWWATEADGVAYASATTFTVGGDKTGVYTAGRALHLAQAASGYGYVVSSTYVSGTGLTTVTVREVVVDSGLDQIEYSNQVEAMPYGVATSSNKGVVQIGTDVPRHITSNTSLYVYSTGSDTTGDGSSGNPWKTLNKAFAHLADFFIASDVLVTIYLDAAVNNMGTTQTLSHPCGNRIQIFGQKQTIAISSIQSTSGSAGAYSIIINVDSVSGVAVGHFLHVNYASGGTNPERMCGLFEVTNVDAVNTRLTVLSKNRIGVPSGAVAATTAQARIIKTVLQFGTGHGISIDRGSSLYGLGALVIDGNGSGMYGLQMGNEAGGDCGGMLRTLDYIGVWDWGEGVLVENGLFYARSLAISCCVDGIYVGRCGAVDAYGAVVSGCSSYGVTASQNGVLTIQQGYVVGNNVGAVASHGGHIMTNTVYLSGFNTTDASPAVNTIGNHNAYVYAG